MRTCACVCVNVYLCVYIFVPLINANFHLDFSGDIVFWTCTSFKTCERMNLF